jgi:hypothetical protein
VGASKQQLAVDARQQAAMCSTTTTYFCVNIQQVPCNACAFYSQWFLARASFAAAAAAAKIVVSRTELARPARYLPATFLLSLSLQDAPCAPGQPIKKQQQVRLQHSLTRKWLHSHSFYSPISGQQEVRQHTSAELKEIPHMLACKHSRISYYKHCRSCLYVQKQGSSS